MGLTQELICENLISNKVDARLVNAKATQQVPARDRSFENSRLKRLNENGQETGENF